MEGVHQPKMLLYTFRY